ncbi:MFS transporter [Streptacidiphilus sp. ASG 303]|uniref:MFS transporter n=1 Tax=Streptacidiphilus sp. ASG 303 TaxID=2896847 RepID=UPI001E4B4BDD|nr:MFS transporter [Streptacidiphilus sp. ASG 303]MCD0486391.1 MFS transporter [Streptacidiphilus sp. ASG 303]
MNGPSSAVPVAGEPQPAPVRGRHAPHGGWPAVASVSLMCFVLVLTEFLPIGLLPALASDLHVSLGTVGLVVVAPGLTAAVVAPLLTVASGRLDRRRVLVMLALLTAASNILAACAPDMAVMAAARVLLGVGVGGFWAMGAGVAVRLVPARAAHRATALITAGISAGTVVSLPLGALVGHLAGWRTAFLLAAGASLLALTALVLRLPALPATGAVSLTTLTTALRRPGPRTALLGAALIFLGHFAAYTYLTPYLEDRAHFGPAAVTAVLLAYGAAGLAGNFAAGAAIGRSPRTVHVAATALVAAVAALLGPLSGAAPAVVALVVVWGAAFGAVPLVLQTSITRTTPEDPESGMALLVSVSQIALAAGSFAGGLVVDGYGIRAGFTFGAALALLSTATRLLPLPSSLRTVCGYPPVGDTARTRHPHP